MEATFLTGIHIHKVRHLENIDIPLSADTRKNLILTGKNGSGKTSVLQELVISLSLMSRGTFYKPGNFRNVEIYSNSFDTLIKKYDSGQFLLSYLRDNRLFEAEISKNIEKVETQPVYSIGDSPAKDFVKYMVNLKAIQAFSKNEGAQQRSEEIDGWFHRLENILRTIYEDDTVRLIFDFETFEFRIKAENREPFGFNTMSMGYAAVFDIIADLMMRMESQHRYDLEGIVLIDEVESHLHVELQKQIVPILTELFPNIQFIMTTHSPFILNSAANAVIYDLEKHMLVENGLTNLPYDGIVESYFGADLLSQELREKFEQYRALVQKADLTDEDFARAAELELYLDEVPDYLALDFATEYSRLKLELANRG